MEVLFAPLDWLLGWVARLGPLAAVAGVGVLSGLAVMLLQKWASDQRRLGLVRGDLARLRERIRGSESAERGRLKGLRGRIATRYFFASLRPALLSVPLIGLVAVWADARLGVLAPDPGETFEVVAYFEDGADGFAHLIPNEGLAPVESAVSEIRSPAPPGPAIGRHARWRVRALKSGTFPLTIRHSDKLFETAIGIAGLPPSPVTLFNVESPTQDQLQAVGIDLPPSVPAAWWNLGLGWMGLYLAVAMAAALAFRRAFKVH